MLEIKELIPFTIALVIMAIVVFVAVYLTLNRILLAEKDRAKVEILSQSIKISLPLRLQAYERLILLMERISPDNLVMRLKEQVQTNSDLHLSLLQNIRMEFEHNLSQQVYVSSELWEEIKEAKEQITTFINDVSKGVNPKNVSMELSKQIFDALVDKGEDFTSQTINKIKKEASKHLL